MSAITVSLVDTEQSAQPATPAVVPPKADSTWTQERVDKLIGFVAMGPSCPSMSAIALDLFGTEKARNAVAGKMFRMGFCNRMTKEQRTTRHGAHNRSTTPAVRAPRSAVRRERVEVQELPPPDIQFLCTLENLGPMTSVDSSKVQCRAPIGDPGTEDFRYCGMPGATMPGPYCAFHNRMFYQPNSANRGRVHIPETAAAVAPDYTEGRLLGEFPMVTDGDAD